MEPRPELAALLPDWIEFRHDLHRHPELGYRESRTAARVVDRLKAAGVRYVSGLAGGTGVVASLPATQHGGRCIALRADMDALPIAELTGLPYASVNPGCMHACGHDGHTTMLIAALETLSRAKSRPHDLLFLFQPAEEGGAGAKRMIADGALEGAGISTAADMIFGLHGLPGSGLGRLTTRVGAMMASANTFSITVRGRGVHAAYPHGGIDPIVAASAVVGALQAIPSRRISPLDSTVITIGMFHAGVAHNVIPDIAELRGTLRALNDETESHARKYIEETVRHTALAYGASAEVEWAEDPYPVTVNHPDAVAWAERTVPNVSEEPEPSMGGEDFSFYGKRIPGAFLFLGLNDRSTATYPNLHTPDFDFNDKAIPFGVEFYLRVAEAEL